jgi:hypothetical protein
MISVGRGGGTIAGQRESQAQKIVTKPFKTREIGGIRGEHDGVSE